MKLRQALLGIAVVFGAASLTLPVLISYSPAQDAAAAIAFETPSGMTPEFSMELAFTPSQRSRGLMYRKHLDPTKGMLFVFPDNEIRSFWMKNTYISLDMLFIDEEFRVAGVLTDVPPLNERPRKIDRPSKYVVELAAGTAARHGIVEGSKLRVVSGSIGAPVR